MKTIITLVIVFLFSSFELKQGYPCHPNGDLGPCTHALHSLGDLGPCCHTFYDAWGNLKYVHSGGDIYPCTHPQHSLGDIYPCTHICY